MNVLSLFDGMSCGQIALKQLGFNIEKYYASEIDKFAIKQTQLNFPDTIQLGSVNEWQKWDITWNKIDIICAGSPCQGFSFAGKQLAFDDPRSKLFFVFVEILNHCKRFNPNVKFLLENVNMKKDHLRIISEYVGIFPVKINSSLVSAQNRERWYWTNIRIKNAGLFNELYTDISQPFDKGIYLKDILQPENEINEKYYLSDIAINRINRKVYSTARINPDKTGTLNTKNNSGQLSVDSGTTLILKLDRNGFPKADQNKASSLTIGGHGYGNHSDMDIIATKNYLQWDVSGKGYKSQQDRAFYENGKHGTLSSSRSENKTGVYIENKTLRRLTPIECSRLQTIPSWYKWECSDSQIYKMLGNGWTVDIICHIFNYLK